MPEYYEIKIQSRLDPGWSDWFSGFHFTQLDGNVTLISGSLPDQTALFGLLKRIRDLNMKLISITIVNGTSTDPDHERY